MNASTNDLYQRAISDIAPGGRYGVARHTLPNGETLFCCVERVAGRSVVVGHMRTTFRLLAAGEEYSKQISRKKAASLLKGKD